MPELDWFKLAENREDAEFVLRMYCERGITLASQLPPRCERCGNLFEKRRPHMRFCGKKCYKSASDARGRAARRRQS